MSEFYAPFYKLPNFITKFPYDTYIHRGWISWGDFLGTGRISDFKRGKEFLTYKESQQWCIDHQIKSKNEYVTRYIKNLLPHNPDRTYSEWISWSHFLYTQKVKRFNTFLPFDEFSNWVYKHKPYLKTSSDYYNWVQTNNIPDFIPKQPRTTYKNKGWNGWVTFFSASKYYQLCHT